ncbi:MAG TPA: DUF3551 domain-containing protein [Pseudolabrys sp.]|nr:DUF3551 domain-containing protein [Pseudolabrys sp.]
MKRLICGGAIALAAVIFHLQPAEARPEAPWCAIINFGYGTVYWDCQYNSIEECRPNVIAGNRGFCNPNPRWEGWYAPKVSEPAMHAKRHKRRVKRD